MKKRITYKRMEIILRNSVVNPCGDVYYSVRDGLCYASLFTTYRGFKLKFIDEQDLLTQISVMEDKLRKEVKEGDARTEVDMKLYNIIQGKKERKEKAIEAKRKEAKRLRKSRGYVKVTYKKRG